MLRRAIESCIEQTAPCEIVVVDEASEDDTQELVKEFPGLKYIRNERPLGHSAAANKGIKAADADWIKPLDDDDWLAPDCIEKMTAAIETARAKGLNPVIISGRAINVDEAGHELGHSRRSAGVPIAVRSSAHLRLMLFDLSPLGTVVQVGHDRAAAMHVGGWNENRVFSHQHGDEVELWIRLAGQGDFLFIPSFVARRTIWPGASQSRLSPAERYRSNLFLKSLIAAQLGEPVPENVKSYLALHWALTAARSKMYPEAARLGLTWLKRPHSIFNYLETRSSRKVITVATPL